MRAGRKSIGACALLVALALLAGCHHRPAEQQVRSAIGAAVTAARANDARGVLDVVSDDFVGNDGELDRQGLRRLLAVRALRQDRTGVLAGPITFERKGDRIIAKFDLVLTGGSAGSMLPERSAVYALVTAWREERGQWICYHATWSGGS